MATITRKELKMNEIISIAAESIATDKVRHVLNSIGTGMAAIVVGIGGIAGEIVSWLPHIAVVFSLAVSCALFYKAYLEIKLTKVRLAKEGRREEDRKKRSE